MPNAQATVSTDFVPESADDDDFHLLPFPKRRLALRGCRTQVRRFKRLLAVESRKFVRGILFIGLTTYPPEMAVCLQPAP